jgi:protein TonB
MTDAGRSRAWMVSMAAHAVIGTVLLMALGTGHTHRKPIEPEPPKRLVWVEPAPLALGVPGGRAAPPAAPAEPASVVPPPSVSETKPPPGRVVAKEPKPRPKPPRLARTGDAKPEAIERPKPPLPVEPASAAVPSEAARAAPSAGAPGGVQQGTVNGAAGGFGDAAVPVGSVAAPPELVERVVPEYPPRARELEIEGQVLLEVVLDRRGRPEADIKVLKSVKLLDAAAIAAVRQWRFRPARGGDGRAVRVVMEVPVRFVLR